HFAHAVAQSVCDIGQAPVRPIATVAGRIFVTHGEPAAFHCVRGPTLKADLGNIELGGYQPLVRRIQNRILVVHLLASLMAEGERRRKSVKAWPTSGRRAMPD